MCYETLEYWTMKAIDDDLLMLRRPFTPEEAEANKERTNGMTERHIQRALYYRHHSSAAVMLPNYTPLWWYEADVWVVTKAGYSIEYEIKVSFHDFKADFRKRAKHAKLSGKGVTKRLPTRFFYVVPELLVSPRDVPDYAGLMYASFSPRHHTVSPQLKVIRYARRLKGEKLTDKTIHAMHRTAYYRFWSERHAFDDYRRDVKKGHWAATS